MHLGLHSRVIAVHQWPSACCLLKLSTAKTSRPPYTAPSFCSSSSTCVHYRPRSEQKVWENHSSGSQEPEYIHTMATGRDTPPGYGTEVRPAAVDTAKRTLPARVMSWSFFFCLFLEPRTSFHQSLIHTTRCLIMTMPSRLSLSWVLYLHQHPAVSRLVRDSYLLFRHGTG